MVPGNAATATGGGSAQVDQAGSWASAQLAHSRIDSRPSWAGYAFIRCLYGERPERRARQLVAEVLTREVAADVADVQLAVSELVSNALQHAPGPHELRMVFKRGIVKVAVLDGGTDHTELAEKLSGAAARQSASDESGRGLQIVTGLFPGAWGTGPAVTCTGQTPAKEVWIEVSRLPAAEAGDLR